jgi:Family of unknown function (DUF6011)
MTKTGTTTSAIYETTVQVYGRAPYTRRVKKIGELFGAVRIEFQDGHRMTTAAGEFYRDYRRVDDSPPPAARKTATCRRCRATLTSTRSVARGIGPVCARLERQEAAARAAGFNQAAIDKARQLIAERAILPIRGRRIFTVISSNGVDLYLTAPQTCNCPAGLRGRHGCYHRAAATMLAA